MPFLECLCLHTKQDLGEVADLNRPRTFSVLVGVDTTLWLVKTADLNDVLFPMHSTTPNLSWQPNVLGPGFSWDRPGEPMDFG